jgi:hypothetical protein
LLPIELCGLCALQSPREVSTKDPIADAIAAHSAAHDLALAATDDDPGLAEFLNDADHACAMRGNDRYIETYTHEGNSGRNQFFASGTPLVRADRDPARAARPM